MLPAAKTFARCRVEQDKIKSLHNCDIKRSDIEARLVQSIVQWDKDQDLHDTRVASCLSVFNDYLGDSALSVVKDELNVLSFRRAWNKLDQHFAVSVGGQQNIADIFSVLNAITYDPKEFTIHQHIENILSLASVW